MAIDTDTPLHPPPHTHIRTCINRSTQSSPGMKPPQAQIRNPATSPRRVRSLHNNWAELGNTHSGKSFRVPREHYDTHHHKHAHTLCDLVSPNAVMALQASLAYPISHVVHTRAMDQDDPYRTTHRPLPHSGQNTSS